MPDRIGHPNFPTVAIGFGTHDIRRILEHVQRGILRAMVLQKYLLVRAAQGRDIAPTPHCGPAEPAEIEALEVKIRAPRAAAFKRARPIDPNGALHFFIPTLQELEAQVRRRSIGRTISEIAMDLGIVPGACDGRFWADLDTVWRDFDGDFALFCEVRRRRIVAFEKERKTLPDTWACRIWDVPKAAIRAVLGYLVGEPPPDDATIAALTG